MVMLTVLLLRTDTVNLTGTAVNRTDTVNLTGVKRTGIVNRTATVDLNGTVNHTVIVNHTATVDHIGINGTVNHTVIVNHTATVDLGTITYYASVDRIGTIDITCSASLDHSSLTILVFLSKWPTLPCNISQHKYVICMILGTLICMPEFHSSEIFRHREFLFLIRPSISLCLASDMIQKLKNWNFLRLHF
jgi:hypothetical protein